MRYREDGAREEVEVEGIKIKLKRPEITRYGWVVVVIVLVCLFIIGLWRIDVAVTCMNFENAQIAGLWGNVDPIAEYHSGLFLAFMSCFFLALIAIYHILKLRFK